MSVSIGTTTEGSWTGVGTLFAGMMCSFVELWRDLLFRRYHRRILLRTTSLHLSKFQVQLSYQFPHRRHKWKCKDTNKSHKIFIFRYSTSICSLVIKTAIKRILVIIPAGVICQGTDFPYRITDRGLWIVFGARCTMFCPHLPHYAHGWRISTPKNKPHWSVFSSLSWSISISRFTL